MLLHSCIRPYPLLLLLVFSARPSSCAPCCLTPHARTIFPFRLFALRSCFFSSVVYASRFFHPVLRLTLCALSAALSLLLPFLQQGRRPFSLLCHRPFRRFRLFFPVPDLSFSSGSLPTSALNSCVSSSPLPSRSCRHRVVSSSHHSVPGVFGPSVCVFSFACYVPPRIPFFGRFCLPLFFPSLSLLVSVRRPELRPSLLPCFCSPPAFFYTFWCCLSFPCRLSLFSMPRFPACCPTGALLLGPLGAFILFRCCSFSSPPHFSAAAPRGIYWCNVRVRPPLAWS